MPKLENENVSEADSIYKGKRVFVTGHTGFKASWLSFWLISLGANVIGFSRHSHRYWNGLYERANLASILEREYVGEEGDITNYDAVSNAIEESKPDILFHLAAMAFVPYGKVHPGETFKINQGGTQNVLDAILYNSIHGNRSVKAAVFITTDKVYYNAEQLWGYAEKDKLGWPGDPYAASKANADITIDCYRTSLFLPGTIHYNQSNITLPGIPLPIVTARAGNVIGGGDWGEGRIVKNYFDRYFKVVDGPLMLTDPKATRPWQHVLDCVGAYLHLGAKALDLNPEREALLQQRQPLEEEGNRLEQLKTDQIDAIKSGTSIPSEEIESLDQEIQVLIDRIQQFKEQFNKELNNLSEKAQAISQAWNVGSWLESNVNLKEFAELLKKYAPGVDYAVMDQPTMKEAKLLYVDITKIYKFLQWSPVLTLDEAVQMTADWYVKAGYNVKAGPNNANTEDMGELTFLQIQEYLEKAVNRSKNWVKTLEQIKRN